jgi:hypothetical protein
MTIADQNRIAILKASPEVLAKLLQLPAGAFIEGICTDDHLGQVQLRIRGAGWSVAQGGLIPTAEIAEIKTREAKPEDMVHSIDWKLP